MYKQSGLLRLFLNYVRKKFYNIGPRFEVVELDDVEDVGKDGAAGRRSDPVKNQVVPEIDLK